MSCTSIWTTTKRRVAPCRGRCRFSTGGHEFTLTIDQADYSVPASMDHAWAELPAYVEDPDYQYVTHYAPLSSTVTARNFTICYDTKKRIANWVAYPIHDCYMQGSYNRADTWAYDPDIPSSQQADLSLGSYRSGGSAVTSACPTTAMCPIPRC